jgi:hypothetical protein
LPQRGGKDLPGDSCVPEDVIYAASMQCLFQWCGLENIVVRTKLCANPRRARKLYDEKQPETQDFLPQPEFPLCTPTRRVSHIHPPPHAITSRVFSVGSFQRGKRCQVPFLPVPEPQNYLQWLNASQPKEEIENIRYAI